MRLAGLPADLFLFCHFSRISRPQEADVRGESGANMADKKLVFRGDYPKGWLLYYDLMLYRGPRLNGFMFVLRLFSRS